MNSSQVIWATSWCESPRTNRKNNIKKHDTPDLDTITQQLIHQGLEDKFYNSDEYRWLETHKIPYGVEFKKTLSHSFFELYGKSKYTQVDRYNFEYIITFKKPCDRLLFELAWRGHYTGLQTKEE